MAVGRVASEGWGWAGAVEGLVETASSGLAAALEEEVGLVDGGSYLPALHHGAARLLRPLVLRKVPEDHARVRNGPVVSIRLHPALCVLLNGALVSER